MLAVPGIDLTGGRCSCSAILACSAMSSIRFRCILRYRAAATLALMIYEVRNTFGDLHAYVLPVKPGQISIAGIRQHHDKLFYVSPFIDMAMRYHFRVSPPGQNVTLRILETDRKGPPARRDLQRPPPRLDHASAAVVGLLAAARHPENHGGDPLGGVEALAQGARLVPRPNAATANAASNTGLAIDQRPEYTAAALTAAAREPGRSAGKRSGSVRVEIGSTASAELGHRATSF